MKQTRTQGFSILAIIAAIVVVAGIACGGYYIFKHKNSTAQQSADTSQPTQQKDTTNNVKDNSPAPADPSEGGKYLVIKEWGVRVLLPENLRGDIYLSDVKQGAVESPSNAYQPPQPIPSESVSFGSKRLDQLAGKSGYSLDTLFFVERTSQEYPESATPYALRDFKSMDGYWYTLRTFKPGAIDIPGYSDYTSQNYQPLIDAVKGLEAAPGN
jgi:hypothetical protein